ncbi:MAG: chorismate-binding protein [Chlamydiia bacterium]
MTRAKCVLARSSLLHSSVTIDPWSFLTQRHYPQSSLVLWTPPQETARPTHWAAATPELLFHRQNEWVESEALAGTLPRRSDNNDDATGQQLISSPKYRLECELVRDHIVEVFSRLGMTDLQVGALGVVSYPHLMHLRIRIRARWPQYDDQQLLKALHPTPAVCGFPQDVSSQLRRTIETRDRGWYTSAVGYSTPQRGWFAVMLRCAEILDPHTLRLWAGAGLTATSDPLMEWEELNTKLRWCTHPAKVRVLEVV